MSAIIFVEGGATGADSKEINSRCREGFRKLLESCGSAQKWRMPRLVACGGRDSVFEDFSRAHKTNAAGDFIAMWIDSEEPMNDPQLAWEHLRNVTTVTKWLKPKGANDDQVLFMTTCMETWILADRVTLRKHYGHDLRESALGSLVGLEGRQRHVIQNGLVRATRKCSNAYKKGKRSFEVFGRLVPAALEKHLPSFVRFRKILAVKLRQGRNRRQR